LSAPESLHELGRARQAARAEKNFALADQLRDQIAQAGYEIVDVALLQLLLMVSTKMQLQALTQ